MVDKRHKIETKNWVNSLRSNYENLTKNCDNKLKISPVYYCLLHGYSISNKTLGEGAYAKVKLAKLTQDKQRQQPNQSTSVAIKITDKTKAPTNYAKKFIPREITALRAIGKHPNVVGLVEHFHTPSHSFLVLDYCQNGDLLDFINSLQDPRNENKTDSIALPESLAKHLVRQLCEGLNYCHQRGIVHRDLKLENLLLDSNWNLRITDFGFSCRLPNKRVLLETSCGSLSYTAPEILLNKKYDGILADVWSVGICVYAIVCGTLPFQETTPAAMEFQMRKQRYHFHSSLTQDCTIIIRKLLQYEPQRRLKLAEVLKDPWICGKTIETNTSVKKQTNSGECCSNHTIKTRSNFTDTHRIKNHQLTETIERVRVARLDKFATQPLGGGREHVTLRSRLVKRQSATAAHIGRRWAPTKRLSSNEKYRYRPPPVDQLRFPYEMPANLEHQLPDLSESQVHKDTSRKQELLSCLTAQSVSDQGVAKILSPEDTRRFLEDTCSAFDVDHWFNNDKMHSCPTGNDSLPDEIKKQLIGHTDVTPKPALTIKRLNSSCPTDANTQHDPNLLERKVLLSKGPCNVNALRPISFPTLTEADNSQQIQSILKRGAITKTVGMTPRPWGRVNKKEFPPICKPVTILKTEADGATKIFVK